MKQIMAISFHEQMIGICYQHYLKDYCLCGKDGYILFDVFEMADSHIKWKNKLKITLVNEKHDRLYYLMQ